MSELFSVGEGRYTIAHKLDDVVVLETKQDVTERKKSCVGLRYRMKERSNSG